MNLSSASVSAVRTLAPLPKVGELAVRFKSNEDVYLGSPTGPSAGFASLEDALSGAAGLVQERGNGAIAVTQRNGAFQANELLQPIWEKGFAREDLVGYASAQVVPLDAPGTSNPKFGSYKFQQDKYGSRNDQQRTGKIEIDRSSGVAAIVGSDWALVNGTLQQVQATRPQPPTPPVDPAPPVDPKPPVDPAPPVDPKPPVNPGAAVVQDVTEAARLATESLRIINTVPATDKGDESTKETRIKAYKTNMGAQSRIEKQFAGNSQEVTSTLRTADASLEDANWQLAKKPSPDGRFNGVDIPGAVRDTQRAVDLLNGLLDSLVAPKAA